MKAYLDIIEKVLDQGVMKENRTGESALTIAGAFLEHDLSEGFPLLTTKKMGLKNICTELEFFIQGYHDKKWLQERNCHIWDEWCSPDALPPYTDDADRLAKQKEVMELGPIYGYQWRKFGAPMGSDEPGIDQLQRVVDTLKTNPTDRRMLVSAWNPTMLHQMALPPCHVAFHVTVIGDTINMTWYQRSCDLLLGIPYNLASYSMLLMLLAKESGFKPGKICGMLSDVHIYESHIENAKVQLAREPRTLPTVEITNFTSIFDWSYTDFTIEGYDPHPRLKFNILA